MFLARLCLEGVLTPTIVLGVTCICVLPGPTVQCILQRRLAEQQGNNNHVLKRNGLRPIVCLHIRLDDDNEGTSFKSAEHTGTGLSFEGTPLVQSPNSKTLVASSDPQCTTAQHSGNGGCQLRAELRRSLQEAPPAVRAPSPPAPPIMPIGPS